MTALSILGISGSLRAASYNSAALTAARRLAPTGMKIDIYSGMDTLPHFNPDLDIEPAPSAVAALRFAVGAADGLLIACPEYAHGIPGSLKNLLDWLVSTTEFPSKPVALINTSPRAADAQAALRTVLLTMSAHIVERACIGLPLLGSGFNAEMIGTDQVIAGNLAAALREFGNTIQQLREPRSLDNPRHFP